MTDAESHDLSGSVATVTLITGSSGPSRELTGVVRRLLGERGVTFQEVRGDTAAGRSLALPTVVATFPDAARPVTYQGYSRILLDLLPLLGRG